MTVRGAVASGVLNSARSFGRGLGCELVVENSPHSLKTGMEVPHHSERAWDPEMWKSGQLFQQGHANPVKPITVRNIKSGELNEADLRSIPDKVVMDGEEVIQHVQLITSELYTEYQDQHLASELVNPQNLWRIVIALILVVGILVIISLLFSASAAGLF